MIENDDVLVHRVMWDMQLVYCPNKKRYWTLSSHIMRTSPVMELAFSSKLSQVVVGD